MKIGSATYYLVYANLFLNLALEFELYNKTKILYMIFVRLMHSEAEGNWVTHILLSSGRRRVLYINVCRPVLPITCESCTRECSPNAGMCATELINNKVVCCSVSSF